MTSWGIPQTPNQPPSRPGMSNTDQLIKSYQDFLKIEKELRGQAENTARGMADLLKELAWRLNEPLMKNIIQNQEPNAPGGWDLSRWIWFFRQPNPEIGVPSTWNIPREQLNLVARLEEEQKRLEACFRELDKRAIIIKTQADRIAELEKELGKKGNQGSSRSSSKNSNTESPARSMQDATPSAPRGKPVGSMTTLLGSFTLRKIDKTMSAFPEAFAGRFSEGEQSRRRQLAILSMIAVNGTSTRHEVYRSLCQNMPDTSMNSLRDALSAQPFLQMFYTARFDVMSVPSGAKVALDVITLSPSSEEVCRAFNFPIKPSEWSRLLEANVGIANNEKRQLRCAATLLLMIHARARNYLTRIASLKAQVARPDIYVQAGQGTYRVKLFVDPEEENYKSVMTTMAANSKDGSVSFCTLNRSDREKVAEFCRAEKIPGCCTDLVSLVTNDKGQVMDYLSIDSGSAFWLMSLSDQIM